MSNSQVALNNPHIALVDMDGVLVDYEGQLCVDLEKMRSPSEPLITRDNIHDYSRDPWIEQRIYTIKHQLGWWENLPHLPLGWEVLEMVRRLFSVHILTKGPSRNFDAWRQKGEWIRKHLGMDVVIHMTESKSVHYGRVLVDDYTEYVKSWLAHRPRGLAILPASAENASFKHQNAIRYDGTTSSKSLVAAALNAAFTRAEYEHWRDHLPRELIPQLADS